MKQALSILFFGSSINSVIILKSLLKANHQLQIITTAPKPAGRHQQTTSNPVINFCQAHQLPYFFFKSLSQNHQALIKIDLIICADFGLLIPEKILNLARLGALNLHPSLLPKYRGPAPIPWAILSEETQTGVSIIQMTSEFDQGPIIAQQPIPIKPSSTSTDLLNLCFSTAAKLLHQILPLYLHFKTTHQPPIEHKLSSKIKLWLPPQPQPKKSPTPYARKLTKQDGLISWSNFKSSLTNRGKSAYNQVRALTPWPHLHTLMPNNKTLKILSAQLNQNQLLPTQVQLAGKTPITWKQFLAGYQHLLQ